MSWGRDTIIAVLPAMALALMAAIDASQRLSHPTRMFLMVVTFITMVLALLYLY